MVPSRPIREDIEHRKTQVKSPQTNAFVQCLHNTFLDEHFRIGTRERLNDWKRAVDGGPWPPKVWRISTNDQSPA